MCRSFLLGCCVFFYILFRPVFCRCGHLLFVNEFLMLRTTNDCTHSPSARCWPAPRCGPAAAGARTCTAARTTGSPAPSGRRRRRRRALRRHWRRRASMERCWIGIGESKSNTDYANNQGGAKRPKKCHKAEASRSTHEPSLHNFRGEISR